MRYWQTSINTFLFILLCHLSYSQINLISPVDHKIVLAGSFGEIRATHFHAGLDIKPSSQSDNQIKAVDLGYVSRIKVARGGYGRAVYIDHPYGLTSVYAHLSSLSPKIDSVVYKLQRENQSYEIEIFPEPGELVFKQGETIGLMGNSGRSYGRHLHFELRDTESEKPINPLLFGIGPQDHIAPTISNVTFYALTPDFDIADKKTYSPVPNAIKIPGWRMGIGISGFDQMDGATNRNGIYQTSVYVDDTLYYREVLDTLNFFEMDQIKTYIDYQSKILNKTTTALTYKHPGNNLGIIDYIKGDGMITLYRDKDRSITIECVDYHGNITTVKTKVSRGDVKEIPNISYNFLASSDLDTTILLGDMTLYIPKGSFPKNTKVSYSYDPIENNIFIGEQASAIIKPLHLTTKSVIDSTHLWAYNDDGDLVDYGHITHGDVTTWYLTSLGRYSYYRDTQPPMIKPSSFPKSIDGHYTFTITDNIIAKGNGKDFDYDVFINNEWHPIEYKDSNNTLYIPESMLTKGDKLKIVLKDARGNEAVFEMNL